MASTWKTVRVFISSTFRDMHAERDYLVKVVFPALRAQLEKYRVHYYDVQDRPETVVYVRAIGIKERNVVLIGGKVLQL